MRYKGYLYSLLGGLSFGAMGFFVHLCAGRIPSAELAFMRALFGFLILLPFVARHLPLAFNSDSHTLWIRSAAGTTAILCLFWTLQHTSVGNANALSYLAPSFVAILSWRFLRESLNRREMAAISVAVIGALSLHGKDGLSLSFGIAAVGIFGALASSIAYLALRQAAIKYTPLLVIWCLSTAGLVASPLFPSQPWQWPARATIFYALAVCLLGLLGQIFLTNAFVHLRAAIASALNLSALLWGVLFSVLLLADYPSWQNWLSYILIIIGIGLLHLKSPEPILSAATLESPDLLLTDDSSQM